MRSPTDGGLIAAIQQGCEEAFNQLYERHYDYVFRTLCCKLLGDVTTAQDITQDVFLKLMRSLPGYEEQGKFSAFLNVIIQNEFIAYWRKEMRRQQVFIASLGDDERELDEENLLSSQRSPEEKMIHEEEEGMIHTFIDQIRNRKNRQVVQMRLLQEMTPEDIADLLECTPNAVKIRLCRGIQEVKQMAATKL